MRITQNALTFKANRGLCHCYFESLTTNQQQLCLPRPALKIRARIGCRRQGTLAIYCQGSARLVRSMVQAHSIKWLNNSALGRAAADNGNRKRSALAVALPVRLAAPTHAPAGVAVGRGDPEPRGGGALQFGRRNFVPGIREFFALFIRDPAPVLVAMQPVSGIQLLYNFILIAERGIAAENFLGHEQRSVIFQVNVDADRAIFQMLTNCMRFRVCRGFNSSSSSYDLFPSINSLYKIIATLLKRHYAIYNLYYLYQNFHMIKRRLLAPFFKKIVKNSYPFTTLATSAAKSVSSFSIPSPSMKRAKPVICTGAPTSLAAFSKTFEILVSPSMIKVCSNSTTSS